MAIQLRIFLFSFLFLQNIYIVSAQVANVAHQINIGDTVPDLELKNILNYKRNYIKFSDFSGKAILLDFWEMFCTPCLKSFPKLKNLQNSYLNDLQIITITYARTSNIDSFFKTIKNQKFNFVTATENDTIWDNFYLDSYFPHHTIPHYVWIDKNRIVRAITGTEDVTEENIKKLISGSVISAKVKVDASTQSIPLEDHLNMTKESILGKSLGIGADNENISDKIKSYSLLTEYAENLGTYSDGRPRSGSVKKIKVGIGEKQRLLAYNIPILLLYKIAYGYAEFVDSIRPYPRIYQNRIVFEIKDSAKLKDATVDIASLTSENQKHYLYCYDIVVASKERGGIFRKMQSDLESYFGLYGKFEIKRKRCLKLIIKDSSKIQYGKGASSIEANLYYLKIINHPISSLIYELSDYNQENGKLIIVDATYLKQNLNFELKTNLQDIANVKSELNKYGLDLIEGDCDVDIFVISDKQNLFPPNNASIY